MKSYQIWEKLAQEQKCYRQKTNWGVENTPPLVLIGLNTPKRKSHVSLERNYDRNIVVLKRTSRSLGRNLTRCLKPFAKPAFWLPQLLV